MKLNERRKDAVEQLEAQLKGGTKPTKLSAAESVKKGLKKYDGKYREPLSNYDGNKKRKQIEILKTRIK